MPFSPNTSNSTFNPKNPESRGEESIYESPFSCIKTEDRERVRTYWEDMNNKYGHTIKYWAHGYDLKEHDALYGEHTTSKFKGPRSLKALINLETHNTILTQFGIMTDNDIQFYIPISEFERVWGKDNVPNRGDLIEIPLESCDRPERQSPKIFEITNKRDSVNPIDPFAGHYVWFIEAKRFDYSYEPNAPDEGVVPISNSKFVGIIKGEQEKSEPLPYGPSSDEEAAEDLYNKSNSGKYGNYI